MAKGGSEFAVPVLEGQEVAGEYRRAGGVENRIRVLKIQAKLHRWAGEDAARRFDDLFNLVVDPAFLAMAWARVRATGVRARRGWTG
jgi:hypothetical protein